MFSESSVIGLIFNYTMKPKDNNDYMINSLITGYLTLNKLYLLSGT